MRVLLTATLMSGNQEELWKYICELKIGLEEKGHEVDVLALSTRGNKYNIFNWERIYKKYEVKTPASLTPSNLTNESSSSIAELLKEIEIVRSILEWEAEYLGLEKYDLIHAQDIISVRAVSNIKPKQTPLIATLHEECLFPGMIKKVFPDNWKKSVAEEYFGMAACDQVIVTSYSFQDVLVNEFKVPGNHLKVIPSCLKAKRFFDEIETVDPIEVSEEMKVIACVVPMDKSGGHQYVLDALAKLQQERTDWVCWIIGDGPEKHHLEWQANDLQMTKNVFFAGDRKDIAALLKRADICVLPSVQEKSPPFLLEMLMAGKPVIASEVGGIQEMIKDGVTGLLTLPGESEQLYQGIKKLFEDLSLKNEIASNAKAKGFILYLWALNRMIDDTLSVYKDLLSSRSC